jgi:hypothetical protein
MQIRSVLVLAAVILGLGAAQESAKAAGQLAPGGSAPAAVASPAINPNAPTESCIFGTGQVQVVCSAGCHDQLNASICTDMEKLFRACMSMKCSHVKTDDADGVIKLMRCQAWAGSVCARVMGCGFSDESGREAQ